jgi:hypothetical protein
LLLSLLQNGCQIVWTAPVSSELAWVQRLIAAQQVPVASQRVLEDPF